MRSEAPEEFTQRKVRDVRESDEEHELQAVAINEAMQEAETQAAAAPHEIGAPDEQDMFQDMVDEMLAAEQEGAQEVTPAAARAAAAIAVTPTRHFGLTTPRGKLHSDMPDKLDMDLMQKASDLEHLGGTSKSHKAYSASTQSGALYKRKQAFMKLLRQRYFLYTCILQTEATLRQLQATVPKTRISPASLTPYRYSPATGHRLTSTMTMLDKQWKGKYTGVSGMPWKLT